MNNEPVITVTHVLAIVAAGAGLLTASGYGVSDATTDAIKTFILAAWPVSLVVAGWFSRRFVTPVWKARRAIKGDRKSIGEIES